MKRLSSLLLYLSYSFFSFSQLDVYNSGITGEKMVEALSGVGVTFTNIDVTGCPALDQMAQFNGVQSDIGIDSGLIMTTGDAFLAEQPNLTGSEGVSVGSFDDGDSDLDDLISPNETEDACIIEFDLTMSGDTLKFNYVFASEEYNEYVCGNVNDAFGFFISGPGINGPFSNNSKNIALIPNSGGIPVSINTVNNGQVGDFGTLENCDNLDPNWTNNSGFFIDNTTGTTLEYDGFTTKLTVKTIVEPCETYHIKLAIADGGDPSYDSGVFLENGSFASAELNFGTAFTDVFEGCTEGGINFLRKDTTKQDFVYIYFGFGGTANNGIDYGVDDGSGNMIPFPDSLILAPGINGTTISIIGDGDGINEDNEEIVIYVLIEDCENGLIPIDSITLTLHDFIYLDIFPDTLVCPNSEIEFNVHFDADTGSIQQFTFDGADYPFEFLLENSIYSETDGFYKADSSLLFSSITDTMMIISIVDSFGCVGTDTLTYDVLEPELTNFTYAYEDPSDPRVIQFINLSQFNSSVGYRWEFLDSSGTISLQTEPIHIFPDTGRYFVGLSAVGPNVVDCPIFKEVEIRPLEVPNVITPNQDGHNDYFEAFGLYDYHLTIYNRWGKTVFEDEFYKNTFNAEGLSDGQYFYHIEYELKGYSFKGWFQVLR